MDLAFAQTRTKARALLAQILPPARAHALETALFFSPPVHRAPHQGYAQTYTTAVRTLLRRLRDPADAGLRLALAAGMLPPEDAIALLHAQRLGFFQRVRAQRATEAARKPEPQPTTEPVECHATPPGTPKASTSACGGAAPDAIVLV